jgi:hypothetical protein
VEDWWTIFSVKNKTRNAHDLHKNITNFIKNIGAHKESTVVLRAGLAQTMFASQSSTERFNQGG